MNKPTSPKRDLYQEVTDTIIEKIVAAIEAGTAGNWVRPWALMAEHGMPRNGLSSRQYNGINALNLFLEGQARGFSDCRHMTFLQASEAGYKIRKGAKSMPVYFFKKLEIEERDQQTGDATKKSIPYLTEYRVFNVEDIQGFEAGKVEPPTWQPLAFVDEMVKRLGVTVVHGNGDRSCYVEATDTIKLPMPGTFSSREAMAGVIAHECAHSTLHPSRRNCRQRSTSAQRKTDPSLEYAREELIAELSSTFLSAETGIAGSMDNHVAYLASWLKVLKNDKHEIFRAASEASKIVSYMLGRTDDATAAVQPASDQEAIQPAPTPVAEIVETKKRRPLREAMYPGSAKRLSAQPLGGEGFSASP